MLFVSALLGHPATGTDVAPSTVLAVLADLAHTSHGTRGAPVHAEAYRQVMAHDPDTVVLLGDFDHRNPAANWVSRAAARRRTRRMHEEVRSCLTPAGCDFQGWLRGVPLLPTWDDHDSTQNNADRTDRHMGLAVEEFKRAWPAPYPGTGIWRSQRVGSVEVFLLDLRSHRTPNGTPDGARKTMLGAEQFAWLVEGLRTSAAPWKLVASSVPFNPTMKCTTVHSRPSDSWCGFRIERAAIVAAVADVPGIVVVSGDVHTGGGLDDGTNSTWPEMQVPHVNLPCSYADTGNLGSWSHGVESGCERPGYGLITATETTLRFEVRGTDGAVRRALEVP